MSLGKKIKLNNGMEIPQLGFGTWQSAPGEVSKAVFEALKVGYRHLDLALIYENQPEVAEGIKKAFKEIPGLKREDLFITSKLWNTQHRPELVEAALDKALKELDIEYLDQFLIHWPCAFPPRDTKGDNYFPLVAGNDNEVEIDDDISIVDTWKAMLKLPKSKTRAVGVSNFSVEHIEAIINATGEVPTTNQVERHPLLPQPELVEYCKKKNIHITAYSAFGNNFFGLPLLVNRDEVKEVAKKVSERIGESVSPAQVILAWSQVGGHSVIPKSVTPSRIAENFKEIELTSDEISAIDALGKEPKRMNVPYTANTPRWDVNIFNDPSEKPATHQINFKA